MHRIRIDAWLFIKVHQLASCVIKILVEMLRWFTRNRFLLHVIDLEQGLGVWWDGLFEVVIDIPASHWHLFVFFIKEAAASSLLFTGKVWHVDERVVLFVRFLVEARVEDLLSKEFIVIIRLLPGSLYIGGTFNNIRLCLARWRFIAVSLFISGHDFFVQRIQSIQYKR